MEIAASTMMSHEDGNIINNIKPYENHEQDVIMPGFRFHPTEEELVEFYLRRKVEGKRFNVELITFLELYRYDPWELPALAAIGEKEWYFYVPRDRKYRNGDRPNRVTTSGYWKATGADRMIRTEKFRSIGLKKTLVFYSGKAPKGIRTSWIMNEYRLPQHETQRYQKAEISLCRVYKRAGVEDHPSLPTRPSSSRGGGGGGGGGSQSHNSSEKNKHSHELQMVHHSMGFVVQQQSKPIDLQVIDKLEGSNSGNSDVTTALGLSKYSSCCSTTIPFITDHEKGEDLMMMMQQSKQDDSLLVPSSSSSSSSVFPSNSSSTAAMDDLNRLVNYQQQYYSHNVQTNPNHLSTLLIQQTLPMSLSFLQNPPPPTTFSDRLYWEWNPISEEHNDTSSFK